MNKKPTEKEIKDIREYVASRGKGRIEFQEQDFITAYENANEEHRKIFRDEMSEYKRALKKGAVREGQPIYEG